MSAVAAATPAGESAISFEAGDVSVDAFRGSFRVPENRSDPSSRMIDVHYVRFPSTAAAPGAPIVYLAGGPGGSGVATARGRRFPLFMAMRAFGDVIALDQRGTGWSATAPRCVSRVVMPTDRAVPDAEEAAMLRAAAEECDSFWRAAGYDPAGYTTVENARDLDALRRHLGAEQVTLWGISYGSHLALAAARELGPRIDRMILASVEGLDQTVKLPSETDAYFGRLQSAIDAEPAAKAIYPDLKALIARVHQKLEADPPTLVLARDGVEKTLLLTKRVMRGVASAMIADPESAVLLLQLYLAVDASAYEPLQGLLAQFVDPGAPETFSLMPLAMDIASGVGVERLAQIKREARVALLGDVLNHPMPQLAGALGLDLGDGFRAAPNGDMPTLALMGTLDGRTYPREQRAALVNLSRVEIVTVANAGHNLFMASSDVQDIMERFMRGERVDGANIIVDAPTFAPSIAQEGKAAEGRH
ncbi:MAG: alpha/beta fold hydrolase [Alphaproteobacteria bacterium]|nr:alpha/beta fold hydrolase [Alphaproteobacteria bacterium]